MNRQTIILVIFLSPFLFSSMAAARGFGGGHGGPPGGGHGGGPGGFHGGAPGGFHPGGFSGAGGFRGGTPGGFGGFNANSPATPFRGGGFSAAGFPSTRDSGIRSGQLSDARPSRGQLNNFLGLPSDAGLHSLSSARPGSHDIQNKVQRDNNVQRDAAGLRDGQREPANALNRYVGGFAGGFQHVASSTRYTHAAGVRGNFHDYWLYRPSWYRGHPGVWYAAGWRAGAVWEAATWASACAWLGCGGDPFYYDYGNNVIYQNNVVYVNGQDAGSANEYYQQAQDLADTGAEAETSKDGQWLPLGVFALTQSGQSSSSSTIQLAVNKKGIIRGNYTNTISGTTTPIKGSVDKKTQRAAWTVGDNTTTVFETGLDNLTKDEAPALVHFGDKRTQQWLLVRLNDKDNNQEDTSTSQ
ncbi:MAG: hypothetical protein N2C12_06890 [Planctomycetales bacterium]